MLSGISRYPLNPTVINVILSLSRIVKHSCFFFSDRGPRLIPRSFVVLPGEYMTKKNPRYKNGSLRRKHRARFKAMGAPCGICKGARGPIHYDEPSNAEHPLSFVIDEILPVSKYAQYGYASRAAAAQDWSNLQAAHWICNAEKSDKTNYCFNKKIIAVKKQTRNDQDGEW